jgi:hypothetical protein
MPIRCEGQAVRAGFLDYLKQLIHLALTVGQYSRASMALNSLGVTVEDEHQR